MSENNNQEHIFFLHENLVFIQQIIQHKATFEQKLIGSDYHLIGEIDGKELLNEKNPEPKKYENMKLNGKLDRRPTGQIRHITLSGI